MENLDIFYDHLVYFTAIGNILVPFGYILWSFGIFFPVLAFCTKKNLATLLPTEKMYSLADALLKKIGKETSN
jgi:hypothetical protein